MSKAIFYRLGRVFQLFALIALPSAIWMGEIVRSERGSIVIFVCSILIFSIGHLLSRLAK